MNLCFHLTGWSLQRICTRATLWRAERRKLTLPVTADQTFKVLSSEPLTTRLPQNCRHVITWSSCPFSTYNTDVHQKHGKHRGRTNEALNSNRNAQATSRIKIYTKCKVSFQADESSVKHFVSIFYYLYMRHQLLKSVKTSWRWFECKCLLYHLFYLFKPKEYALQLCNFDTQK